MIISLSIWRNCPSRACKKINASFHTHVEFFLTNYVTVSFTIKEWLYDLPLNYRLFLLEWYVQQLSHGWWNSYSFCQPSAPCPYTSHIPLNGNAATNLQLLIFHFSARSNCHTPQREFIKETDNGRDSVFTLHCHNLLRSFLFLSGMRKYFPYPFWSALSSAIK